MDERYEALREQHMRLRKAAEAVIVAASYPGSDEEPRVYASQLKDLARELRGEPRPRAMAWMSVS